VQAWCLLMCGLFSVWYAVWSLDGLQEVRRICVADVEASTTNWVVRLTRDHCLGWQIVVHSDGT